jgi:hypothetical protein
MTDAAPKRVLILDDGPIVLAQRIPSDRTSAA